MGNTLIFALIFVSLWAVAATSYVSEVSNDLAPRSPELRFTQRTALASEVETGPVRLKQAPREQEKVGRSMSALAAEPAQAWSQDREKIEEPVRELMAELVQVKLQLREHRNKPKEPPAADVSRADQGASRKNSTTIARKTAVELQPSTAADSSDAARLLAHATLFLSQGNVRPARMFLELAVDKGRSPAPFALAETYDPPMLAAWGTLGTQGDSAKARDLYKKALIGGVEEATDRLKSLHKEKIASPPSR